MPSTRVRAPCARAVLVSALRSSTRPSADCTTLAATNVVRSVIDSTSASSGTARTVTPRASWAANG